MISKKLILFALLFSSSFAQISEKIATIYVSDGDCYVKNYRVNLQFKKAIPGRDIYNGDIIKTKDDSYCYMQFKSNKTSVQIGENSSVQFFSNGDFEEINLMQGNVYIKSLHDDTKNTILSSFTSKIFIHNDRLWMSSDYLNGDEVYSLTNNVQLLTKSNKETYSINSYQVYKIDLDGKLSEKNDMKNIPDYVKNDISTETPSDIVYLEKYDLIPIYGRRIHKFINDDYDLAFGLGAYSFDDTSYVKLALYPSYKENNIFFGLQLESYHSLKGNNFKKNWDDFYDILDKTYLSFKHLKNNNELFFQFGQNINDIKFGEGYLLNNVSRCVDYPKFQSSGLYLKYIFDRDFMDLDIVIPSVRDFANSGGLIGIRTSLFLSHKFPLTLGLGIVADINQFSTLTNQLNKKMDKKRNVYGVEIDFTYDLISNLDMDLSLFSEFVGIWYPEYTYYVLSDDGLLSDDLRWRKGVWGIKGPGVKMKVNNRYTMKFSINMNSATFLPGYFNSNYLYNKARYYVNSDLTYPLVQKQIDFIETNFAVPGSADEFFIPKDVYPILFNNNGFSTYPVFGFTTEHSYALYKYLDVSVLASFFMEDSNNSDQYYDFEVSLTINDKFIRNLSFLDIYYSNTFFTSFLDKERMIAGINVGVDLPMRLTLIINLAQVYYDSKLSDNKIDPMKNLGIGLNYNF